MTSERQTVIAKAQKKLTKLKVWSREGEIFWKGLHEQRINGLCCDVKIKCGETKFHAQRCILASVSKYFEILCSTSLGMEDDQHIITFNNFSEETIARSIDLIYHQIPPDDLDIVDILKFCKYIQCDWLLDVLTSAIKSTISKDNFSVWKDIAIECGIENLFSDFVP